MKRRDFNRLVLGAGVSPIFAKSSLAQMSAEEIANDAFEGGRTEHHYQEFPADLQSDQCSRKYTAGRRRFTIYWTWSYPWEANRDVTELDNRFSTMTEVRRVGWSRYEKPEWSEREFLQGIAGTLELFHLSTVRFQNIVGEATGHPVVVYQRIDQAGQRLPLDDQVLGDTDTMMIFGLDHMITEQEAIPAEIEAVRKFLTREGTCLMIGPHHDVGVLTIPGGAANGICAPRRSVGPQAATLRPVHALSHEGAGRASGKSMGTAPSAGARDKSDRSADGHEGLGYPWMAHWRQRSISTRTYRML